MILEPAEVAATGRFACDVCVVGAGPAGIALARELARTGASVVVVESGGKKFDKDAHDLDKGSVVDPAGHGPLEDYRRRRLGGATTAWGGRVVPFDPIDFERRDFVPDSGWPFPASELDDAYRRAQVYCDAGAYAYDAERALGGGEMIPGLHADELTQAHVYRFSPPTNFGARFEAELAAAPNVRVLTFTTVTEIVPHESGLAVAFLAAKTKGGGSITLEAKRYVLAGGGLEVARLLLSPNRVHDRGIGNDHDLVGRFYMCHVTSRVDVVMNRPGLVWDYERTRDGVYCQRTLAVTEAGQRAHHLLNHRARVEHPEISDPEHGSGVLSATYIAKSLVMKMAANPLLSDGVNVLSKGVVKQQELVRPLAHVANVARDLPNVLRFSNRWVRERILASRKLPSMVIPSANQAYTLRIDAEQAPSRESRVRLGDERDALGMRRLVVDWRATSLDLESLAGTARLIAEGVEASGIGRASWSPPGHLEATGGHHVGTARMAESPARGVVDADGKVHGVANLFVASSATFPTCSYANPTLTIVAMALRLADHLTASLA